MPSVVAALVLLAKRAARAWPLVWPRVHADRDFGRWLVVRLASARYHPAGSFSFYQQMPSRGLADLYLWVRAEQPPEMDVEHEGVFTPDAQWHRARLRGTLMEELKARGTQDAVTALRFIADELPGDDSCRFAAAQAETARLRATWGGTTPDALRRLAADNQARLVESAPQLLEVVIESLTRYQERLHAETPAVEDLWNNVRGDRTPRDEAHLSNHLKRHLDDDLRGRAIVVNREPEVKTGAETDIRVEVVLPEAAGQARRLVVIIEVKGCWHRDLKKGMGDQLCDRYLAASPGACGLYLVGWFQCQKWASTASRRRATPNFELAEAQRVFAEQAATQRQRGRVVRSFVLDAALR